MGCHVAKSSSSYVGLNNQQIDRNINHVDVADVAMNEAPTRAMMKMDNTKQANEREEDENGGAAAEPQPMEKDIIVDTQPQTQSQSTNAWTNIADSQPMENVIWGRLYPKSVKHKSLGTLPSCMKNWREMCASCEIYF